MSPVWVEAETFAIVQRDVRCWFCGRQWKAPSDDVVQDSDTSWLCADPAGCVYQLKRGVVDMAYG